MKNLLDAIKRNLFLIVCILVVLLAIGAIMPIGKIAAANEQEIQRIKGTKSTLSNLLIGQVASEEDKTKRVANENAIKVEDRRYQALKDVETRVVDQAIEFNKRRPLVDNVFPKLNSDQAAFNYRNAYRRVFDDFLTRMAAGMPPSERDITRAMENSRALEGDAQRRGNLLNVPLGGDPMMMRGMRGMRGNMVGGAAANRDPKQDLARDLALKQAQKIKLYASRESFQIAEWATADTRPTPNNMWLAQVEVWLQEDVIEAIAKVNESSQSVLGAPVKRLIEFKTTFSNVYALPAEHDLSRISFTGRASGDLFDVVLFEFTIVVDSRRLPLFFKQMAYQNYFTLLNMQIEALQRIDEDHRQIFDGYIYGTDPVVQVSLAYEAMFFRDYYQSLMPEAVQKYLGLIPEESNLN